MDVLIHVTNPAAAPILAGLGRALSAKGAAWGVFFTNDGVKALDDAAVSGALEGAARAVVCEHSWSLHMNGAPCPVEEGSQTTNSALMAEATRLVSL